MLRIAQSLTSHTITPRHRTNEPNRRKSNIFFSLSICAYRIVDVFQVNHQVMIFSVQCAWKVMNDGAMIFTRQLLLIFDHVDSVDYLFIHFISKRESNCIQIGIDLHLSGSALVILHRCHLPMMFEI